MGGAIAKQPEAVRLVIWDLDDTFWRGTLAEGGIEAFVEANHALVIELCRRGIMNSICSKNDRERALAALREIGLAEYFVFPSISFAAKGPRVAEIIETMGLRAPSVLFIDDRPANLAEAAAFAPGLQTADERFVGQMLDDPRFRGKDDASLSRLKQYQLLERRKRDEVETTAGADAFLRGCDIRMTFEYDIEAHVDRAIELVNRTNQLNFTKQRLPEQPEAARAELLRALHSFDAQAALVRVSDRYGDYGFAGFYLVANGRYAYGRGGVPSRLLHFCFSCRVLGMGVERWLYAHLGRPEIAIAGETAANLAGPEVDWITIGPRRESAAPIARLAPEIRAQGGCEMLALASYLRPYAGRCEVIGNVQVGSLFLSLNSATLALSTLDRARQALAPILDEIELPAEIAAPRLFEDAPEGTAFVFSGMHDSYGRSPRYRHRATGWEFHCSLRGFGDSDLLALDRDAFAARLAGAKPPFREEEQRRLLRFHAALGRSFERREGPGEGDAFAALARLIERTPRGGKFVISLDSARVRRRNGEMAQSLTTIAYNAGAKAVAAAYPFAATVDFSDAIGGDEDIVGIANHYARKVYLRAAELIRAQMARLPGR